MGRAATVARTALALSMLSPAGVARAQSAPVPLAVLDVPFISQSEALCGGAAAAMVLRYWGARGVDAESFAHLVNPRAGGIATTDLATDLARRGWSIATVSGTDEQIDTALARGQPVLTLIEDRPGTYHYVVIVASTPRAVVFHDPARAAFRVMNRAAFAGRWAQADQWMAIVLPGTAARGPDPRVLAPPVARGSCEELIADGLRDAQANNLDAAERRLTAALSCGGTAALRELAGLRLLQRRWPEVSELAADVVAADPGDTHAWELLATSRFVQDDQAGALEAWNHIGQPRVDLLTVDGLTRTRQAVVERLLGVPSNVLLTPERFAWTDRRLAELPSASSVRLAFIPFSSGIAELQAHVVERPVVPTGRWSYARMALLAAARSEVDLSIGSLTGGGERLTAGWRFWPGRPRVRTAFVAPAPWGGLWGLDVAAERQSFAGDQLAPTERAGAGLTVSNWLSPWARVSVRGGIDRWVERGSYGVVSGAVRLASSGKRVGASLEGVTWAGREPFATFAAEVQLRTASQRRGRMYVARGGVAAATVRTPPDTWFGGDTGRTRSVPLRAHPVIDDGGLRLDQLGRRLAYVSVEAQQWWQAAGALPLGAAVFADVARVGGQLAPAWRQDVDIGVGARVGVPGLDGVFRLDLARGLRDGATAVSFVYEP